LRVSDRRVSAVELESELFCRGLRIDGSARIEMDARRIARLRARAEHVPFCVELAVFEDGRPRGIARIVYHHTSWRDPAGSDGDQYVWDAFTSASHQAAAR
jgi:hypothetical protein